MHFFQTASITIIAAAGAVAAAAVITPAADQPAVTPAARLPQTLPSNCPEYCDCSRYSSEEDQVQCETFPLCELCLGVWGTTGTPPPGTIPPWWSTPSVDPALSFMTMTTSAS